MRSPQTSACITRVVMDGDCDIELAELQSVTQRIQQSLQHIPASQRVYIANALLNLAISRMVSESGAQRTSTVLIRLIDVVLEDEALQAAHKVMTT